MFHDYKLPWNEQALQKHITLMSLLEALTYNLYHFTNIKELCPYFPTFVYFVLIQKDNTFWKTGVINHVYHLLVHDKNGCGKCPLLCR